MRNLKGLLLLVAIMFFTGAYAQEQELRIKEEGKTLFNPHWFIQVQGGAAYTVGECDFVDLISPSAALNFGYNFNPRFGLRFGASGWQGKGGWCNNPGMNYKFNYIQGNLDAMLDLTNLFKSKPKRAFHLYGFLGVGYNFAFNNSEAVALANEGKDFYYLWDKNKHSVAGRAGLNAAFRLNSYLDINIEGNANLLSDKFNSKFGGNVDWQFNLLAGLTIRLGKDHKEVPPVYYDPEPAPAPKREPAPQQEATPTPEPEPVKTVVVKPEPMAQNVYFDLNKSVIRKEQVEKVDAIVEYLNNNPEAKVTVVGYADKNTGNSKINLRLSKERAAAVKKMIVAKGIAEDRVVTDAKGDTEQPFSVIEENRVSICVAE